MTGTGTAETGSAGTHTVTAGPGAWPRRLQVAGLGRAGAAVAGLAAAAGVEALALWDPTPVGPGDVGTGLLAADLGRERALALEARLAQLLPGLHVYADRAHRPGPLGETTVAVDVPDLAGLAARARAADHPLLPVRLGADGVRVGPWTGVAVPGCVLCESDPADGDGGAGDAAASADPVAALRAAVLVADVLRGVQDAHGVVLAMDPAGRLTRRPVTPRPGCACGAGALPWPATG